MKKDFIDVKNALYEGMCIYNKLMYCKLKIDNYKLNMEDKLYLSLYLGLINTNNKISKQYKSNHYFIDIEVYSELLNDLEYKNIYDNYFKVVLKNINYNNLNDYYNYLINKDIIKLINKTNRINVENINSKKLVKK